MNFIEIFIAVGQGMFKTAIIVDNYNYLPTANESILNKHVQIEKTKKCIYNKLHEYVMKFMQIIICIFIIKMHNTTGV